MSRGIHSKPNGGEVCWLTPKKYVRAFGKFDLDPCAHPDQFYRTARKMISPPRDGLSANWKGKRIWLNPPYGPELVKWMRKMANEGTGIALIPSRTEVERWFWPFVWESARSILFVKGRIYFHKPDGSTAGNAGHGSVFAAYGSDKEVAAMRDCGIEGKFLELKGNPCPTL